MPHRWLVGCGLWNFKGSPVSCGDILNRQLDVSPVLKSDFDLGAGGRTELGQLQSTAGNRSGLSNPNPNLNCQTQFESKYGHEICFSETHQLLLSSNHLRSPWALLYLYFFVNITPLMIIIIIVSGVLRDL